MNRVDVSLVFKEHETPIMNRWLGWTLYVCIPNCEGRKGVTSYDKKFVLSSHVLNPQNLFKDMKRLESELSTQFNVISVDTRELMF